MLTHGDLGMTPEQLATEWATLQSKQILELERIGNLVRSGYAAIENADWLFYPHMKWREYIGPRAGDYQIWIYKLGVCNEVIKIFSDDFYLSRGFSTVEIAKRQARVAAFDLHAEWKREMECVFTEKRTIRNVDKWKKTDHNRPTVLLIEYILSKREQE